MRNILSICIILTGSFLTACSGNHSKSEQATEGSSFDKSKAKSFIDSINSVFSARITQADSTGLASLYWPDAELLLDNAEPIKGKDILPTWGAFLRMGLKKMSFTTTDVTGASNFIIETGSYEMKDDKDNVIDKGKYVVVWEKRNGEWKLYRDIGCTSRQSSVSSQ